ncbi:uncharacterized protein LOC112465351, partial [Temnothorax curvispinosus]|uniref:Uncharacterized protein LOC112465351 n=1 Tax=Temnothorax curvispinosus TaxID=300111 RepID=A0A6J1R6R6_9HYME
EETGVLSPNEDEKEEEFGSCSEHMEHTDKTAIMSEEDAFSDNERDCKKRPAPKSVKQMREMERLSRERLRRKEKEGRKIRPQSDGRSRLRSREKHGQLAHEEDDDDEELSSPSRKNGRKKEKKREEDDRGSGSDEDEVTFIASSTELASQAERQKFPEGRTRAILGDTQEKLAEALGENCPQVGMDREEKGRGRKAETGEYYIKRLNDAKDALLAEAEILRALRAGMAPDSLSNSRRVIEKEMEEELSNAPTETLPSRILEAVNNVDMVAQKSKNLQGPYTGMLNRSAATVKVAISHLLQRKDSGLKPHERDAELDRLRQKIAEQENEIRSLRQLELQHEALRRELEEQKEQMSRLQEAVQGKTEAQDEGKETRGAKRKKVNQFPSSDDEDNGPSRGEKGVSENGSNKDTLRQETEEMEIVGEEETTVTRKDEIMREIGVEGMPAVIRPSIQGKRMTLDPEVPPAAAPTPAAVYEEGPTATLAGMQARLAEMLVKCVNEKVNAMGENLLKIVQERLPQAPGKNRGGEEPLSLSLPQRTRKENKKGGKREEVAKKNPTEETKKEVPRTGTQNRAAGAPSSLAQTSASQPEGDTWSQVIGRREKAAARKERQQQEKRNAPAPAKQQQQKQSRRREPKTSAITLTCPKEMYAEYMRTVRQAINPKDLGIDKPLNTRRTATGALCIELSGQGSAEKADALAARMHEVDAHRKRGG